MKLVMIIIFVVALGMVSNTYATRSYQAQGLYNQCMGETKGKMVCYSYLNGYVGAYETWAKCSINRSIVSVSKQFIATYKHMAKHTDMKRIKAHEIMFKIVKRECR